MTDNKGHNQIQIPLEDIIDKCKNIFIQLEQIETALADVLVMVHRQNMFSSFVNHDTIQTFLFTGPPSNTTMFSKCQALACLKFHQELIHGMLEEHKNSHPGEPDNPILTGFVIGGGSIGEHNAILY